jgi:hypothetical protein
MVWLSDMASPKLALKRKGGGDINAAVRPDNGRGVAAPETDFLNNRARKLIGGAGMLAFVLVYALIAMALAQSRPIQEAPALAQTVCYAILGLAWTLPLMPLIKWMERRNP